VTDRTERVTIDRETWQTIARGMDSHDEAERDAAQLALLEIAPPHWSDDTP
jgi:hypothetical protein